MFETEKALQKEYEKREALEFIEIFNALSEVEKAEVKGYVKCLHSIRILNRGLVLSEKTRGD